MMKSVKIQRLSSDEHPREERPTCPPCTSTPCEDPSSFPFRKAMSTTDRPGQDGEGAGGGGAQQGACRGLGSGEDRCVFVPAAHSTEVADQETLCPAPPRRTGPALPARPRTRHGAEGRRSGHKGLHQRPVPLKVPKPEGGQVQVTVPGLLVGPTGEHTTRRHTPGSTLLPRVHRQMTTGKQSACLMLFGSHSAEPGVQSSRTDPIYP